MQPSRELGELYREACAAQSTANAAFFEQRFSREPGVLAIGTDPTEWWTGYKTITRVFGAQLVEVEGFEVVPDDPEAYCEGSVGWVAGRPTLRLPDGTTLPVRLTVVAHREDGEWKIVQWHFSVGVANEEAIGETLTTE